MAKLPKDMVLVETQVLTRIETSNYNETLLLMQVILFLFPVLAANIYFILNHQDALVVFIPLFLAVVYWIISNIKDKYVFFISTERLKVLKGMYSSVFVDLPLKEIRRVKIRRKYGKVYTHARTGGTSETANTDELVIETPYEEILVTSSLTYGDQLFIRNKIQERMEA